MEATQVCVAIANAQREHAALQLDSDGVPVCVAFDVRCFTREAAIAKIALSINGACADRRLDHRAV